MAAWELKIFFVDGKHDIVGKADTPKISEEQKDFIFKTGHTFTKGKTHYYYPASSILRAEITHREGMEPD